MEIETVTTICLGRLDVCEHEPTNHTKRTHAYEHKHANHHHTNTHHTIASSHYLANRPGGSSNGNWDAVCMSGVASWAVFLDNATMLETVQQYFKNG
jgi:hypothetical protein